MAVPPEMAQSAAEALVRAGVRSIVDFTAIALQVPDDVFGEPYVPPVTDGSGQDRRWLRRANQLLTEAGFALKDGKRFLLDSHVGSGHGHEQPV